MKRISQRIRSEDGGSSSADAGVDFNAKTREFLTLCESTSQDLQETRARLKATMDLVEEKNRELTRQKEAHDAAIETEGERIRDLSEERDELLRSRTALVEEFRAYKLRHAGDAEKYQRLAEQRLAANEELKMRMRNLEEDTRVALEAECRAVEKLTAEKAALKAILDSAKDNFTDCITLSTSPGVLLTSGQMLNLDGIVGMWLNSPRFNGDIWFPFQCPLTNKTTTPVRDLSEWRGVLFCEPAC